MLLTISTTHEPATDLGFLLHKNSERIHRAELSLGIARVVYPEATSDCCTAAVVVEVDPVRLERDRKGPKGNDFSLAQYVNDRPYAASSFLSAASNKMFGTALSGRSKERPELAETAIPVDAHLPVVPCRGGEAILRRLFEPLGYELEAAAITLGRGQGRRRGVRVHGGWRLGRGLPLVNVNRPLPLSCFVATDR